MDQMLNEKAHFPRQVPSKFQKRIDIGSTFENSKFEDITWGKLKSVKETDEQDPIEGKTCPWCNKVIKHCQIWIYRN